MRGVWTNAEGEARAMTSSHDRKMQRQRERREAAQQLAAPPARNRNIDYARELFGLFIDVP